MATNRNKRLVHTPIKAEEKAQRSAGILEVKPSYGFIENQKMTEVMPGYHTGSFQAIASGDQTLTAKYFDDVKVTTITVRPIPSKLVSTEFTGGEGFVYQNEIAEVLLTFDKPLVEGQQPLYRTNPNLMIATKLVLAEDLRSGTFTVMGVNVGDGRVFASLGGVDKDATIIVKETPAILSRVLVKPNPVFEGSNVEIRLVHDKAPNKELINIDVDPSFAIQGELAVEGTDAVAVYKTSTFGDYAVEATSHKITKSATVNVNKVMPKITGVVVPESVLSGKEFTVEVEFDKDQYLNASDVEISFDRNAMIRTIEAPKVVGTKVIGTYEGTIGYATNVVIKYLSVAYDKVSELTIRAQAKVSNVIFDPEKIVIDGKSTVTVEFDKAFEADQDPISVEVNSYISKSKEFTLTGPDNLGGTFKVTGIKEGQGTATLVLGGVTTTHNINVGAKPPVLEDVQLAKSSIRKGEKTTLTCTMNKPDSVDNLEVEVPANIQLYGEPSAEGVTVIYGILGLEVGETANITVKHKVDDVVVEDETKNVAITVIADAKVDSLTGNETPEYKSEVEITLTADKAKLEGQDEPVFTIPEEDFAIVKPFAWDEGNITGKITIKPLKYEGIQTISVLYGEVTKELQISPKKAEGVTISEVDLDYPSIEVGEVATLVVTTNKPIATIDEIPVEVNDFLTYNNDASIESDNTMRITVTGKGVGEGIVTFKPNGGDKTQNVTVSQAATLQSVESEYSEILLNLPVKCTAKFDIAPNKDKIKITPNQASACEVGETSVSGNNIEFTVTMKQAVVCNLTIAYNDITKPLAITGFDGPNPTAEIECSDATATVLLNNNFDLTLEFDAEPNAEKLKVTLPEGVENVTPVAVSETTKLKGTYKITTEGAKEIKFNYLGVEKSVTVTGTVTVTATEITLTPDEANLQPGDEFDAKVTFSGPMSTEQETSFSVDASEGLTKKDNLVVDSGRTFATQKFTINENAAEEQIITFNGVSGSNIESFTPVAKAILESVEATPDTANVGADITVKYTFDKAPRLEEVALTYDEEKLSVKEEAKIAETNKVVVVYTAIKDGSAEVKAVHNTVEKAATITINLPTGTGVTFEPAENVENADEFTAKLAFSYAIPEYLKASITVDQPEGLTKVGELTFDEANMYVTQKYKATEAKEHTVTFAGVTGTVTGNLTTTARPVIQSVAVPTAIEVGQTVDCVVALDKAPIEALKPQVTLEFDTEKFDKVDELTWSEAVGTQKLKAKAAGSELVVTAKYKGEGATASEQITIADAAVLQSVTSENDNIVVVGQDIKVTFTFDKKPTKVEDLKITFTDANLTEKTPAAFGAENTIEVTYTGKAAIASTEVKGVYLGGEEKSVTIAVDPTLGEVTAEPNTLQAGTETEATITIPFTGGDPEQGKINVSVNEFLQEATELSVSGATATCKVKAHATSDGAGVVTVKYNNKQTKTVNITVSPTA